MRLKPNGELFAPPALSRLIELETLSAGITGKAALWRSLQTVSAGEPRLQAFEFGILAARALEQRDRVDAYHDSLVAATFPKSA